MWTLPQKVRDTMGLEEDSAIDDRELEELIRIAQEHVKEELFIYHYDETVSNNPDTGDSWNGTNKTFQSNSYPIVDSDYDNSVSSNDVTCRWIDSTYTKQTGTVSVTNDDYGILSLTQADGSTAIPANAEDVRIDYYSCHRKITQLQLENLTTYLTAHYVKNRLKTGTSISLADFQKNQPIILQSPSIYLNIYRDMISQLQRTSIRGV